MERTFWLDDGSARLLAVYHPVPNGSPPRAAWVFVHPLFEEKKSAHRILVETARTFAAAGIAVLRFDLAGCGDSQGTIETASPSVWQSNIGLAVQWLSQRMPERPLGVLGLRMGATLALAALPGLAAVQRLILWEPVIDGAAWLRERRRQRLVREMLASGRAHDGTVAGSDRETDSLDVDGFRLSAEWVQAIESLGVERLAGNLCYGGSSLILQIGSAARPGSELETLQERLRGQDGAAEIRHVRAPPFWNRLEPQPCPEVAATTLDWLSSTALFPTPPSGPIRRGVDRVSARHEADEGPDGERAVTFGDPGHRLCGVWHPAGPAAGGTARGAAVLFLHGWGAYRIGPHRMFVHAARYFAGQGIPVLRFDFSGRGDSDGSTEEATIDSMTADACLAWNELRNLTPDGRRIILGMCSGAKIAAAVAADRSNAVDGVILWSPEPPEDAEKKAGGIRTVRRRSDIWRAYRRKLMHPAVWRKAIAGRVNWSLVRRALWGRRGPEQVERQRDHDVYRAFGTYPGPRLLVFGNNDPSARDACDQHRRLAQASGAEYRQQGIDNADHNFYHAAWERAVIEISAEWLAKE